MRISIGYPDRASERLLLAGSDRRDMVDTLPALLVGSPWLLLWFHAADQEMVQRGLSARSAGDAKLGSVLGGALKLTVPFLFCLPGLVARHAPAIGRPDLRHHRHAAHAQSR